MSIPDIKIRGIRSPIPTGHVIGRVSSGTGDAELIHITDLANQLVGTGSVASTGGGGIVGANPSATASDVAVNGSAVTYMRSDAAPAVQKTSATVFGLCKVDGSSITASGGTISSTGATFANPTATASDTAVNGTATTAMRSDAAPAIQKTSASVFGLCKVDGSSITASSGVISATGTGTGGAGLFSLAARVPSLASFTGINISGTSSTSENAGIGISVIDTGKGTVTLCGLTKAVPASTPYRVAILLIGTSGTNSSTEYCWGWTDGTKFDTMGLPAGAGPNQESWTNSGSRSSFSSPGETPLGLISGFMWLGLSDDGTNRFWEFSGDGANFTTIQTNAKTAGFLGGTGYTNIFFGLRPSGIAKTTFTCLCYDVAGLSRVVGV